MAVIEYDGSDAWVNEPRVDFEEGVYGAVLTAWGENQNGNHKLTIKVTDEGDYKGATQNKTIGADLSKRGNKSQMATVLVALGMPREKALADKVKFDPDKLIGKKLHFYTRPKAEGEQYAPVDFLPPDKVDDIREMYANKSKHGGGDDDFGAAPAAAAPKATPKNGAAKNGKQQPPPEPEAGGDEADPFA